MQNLSIWISYITGALLTLAWKLGRYVYMQRKQGVAAHTTIMDWFFEDSTDNTVSWVATIGAVWIIGSAYVSQGELLGISLSLPLDCSVAFFLGGMMEMIAPNVAKYVVQKVLGIIETITKGGQNAK
jgi:hypothetical protein